MSRDGVLTPLACLIGLAFLCRTAIARDGISSGTEARRAVCLKFDERSGTALHDSVTSRQVGTIHGPTWVADERGGALYFQLPYDAAYCRFDPPLDCAKGLTVTAWVKPERLDRSSYVFSMYGCNLYIEPDGRAVFRSYWDAGRVAHNVISKGRVEVGKWNSLAIVYDPARRTKEVHVNGKPSGTRPDVDLIEVITDEMLLGAFYTVSNAYDEPYQLKGLLGEIQVHERPLSGEEIELLHTEGLGRFRGRLPFPERSARLCAAASPERQIVRVDLEYLGGEGFPEGAVAEIGLFAAGKPDPVQQRTAAPVAGSSITQVSFPTTDLPAGKYEVRAAIKTAKPVSADPVSVDVLARPAWLEEHPEIRVLNNFVWELLSRESVPQGATTSLTFHNPRDGWVFISIDGSPGAGQSLTVSLEGGDKPGPVIRRDDGATGPSEAMRFLPAGDHRLTVSSGNGATGKDLVVRAIPALVFSKTGTPSALPGYHGPTEWEYIRKEVLSSANGIVTHAELKIDDPIYKEWKERGGRWYTDVGTSDIPSMEDEAAGFNAEMVYQHWVAEEQSRFPLRDGRFLSEFGTGYFHQYPVWSEAVRRLSGRPRSARKEFLPYVSNIHRFKPGRDFCRTVVDCGYHLARKIYLRTPPTEERADALIHRWFGRETMGWEESIPGVARRTVLILGYFSGPPEGLDQAPNANFKVFMDKMLRFAANDPVLFGTPGVMWYNAKWVDRDTANWGARLLRHYCIEGNRGPLTRDRYVLDHIVNHDFVDGTTGWTVEPASDGGIRAGRLKRFYWMRNIYCLEKQPDTFCVMKRDAGRANRLSQEIRNLEPGRTYWLKLYSADHGDLSGGTSDEKKMTVSIRVEGADELPDESGDYVYTVSRWHGAGKFGRKNLAWINYHVRAFRAKTDSARLSISDWKTAAEAGGPIGQETIISGVRIEPFLD